MSAKTTRLSWRDLDSRERDEIAGRYQSGTPLEHLIREKSLIGKPQTIRRRIQEWLQRQQNGDEHINKLDDSLPLRKQATMASEGDVGTAESVDVNIRTLDQLLDACQVDLSIWEVERYTVNKWATARKNKRANINWVDGVATGSVDDLGGMFVQPLFQVKAWLRRKVPLQIAGLVEDLKADLLQFASPRKAARYPRITKPALCEIAPFDLHLGKMAWGEETGQGDYDAKIAKSIFLDAILTLLGHATKYEIERFVFPVGQDFLHVDNDENETAHGTRVDTDGRFKKLFRDGRRLLVDAIELMRPIAPVDVLVVPGNHDTVSMFHLGDAIECFYHNDPSVRVDNSPTDRKYYQYNKCLLAYCHGRDEKLTDLPLIMATERPEMWAQTKWRHYKVGHFHHKRDFVTETGSELRGVRVSILPSLSSADRWHYSHGYMATRAAEAFVWDGEAGQIATFSYNV